VEMGKNVISFVQQCQYIGSVNSPILMRVGLEQASKIHRCTVRSLSSVLAGKEIDYWRVQSCS
jgi:hypothetical protein